MPGWTVSAGTSPGDGALMSGSPAEASMDPDDHPLLNVPSLTALILRTAAEAPTDPDQLLGRLDGLLATAHEPAADRSTLRPRLQGLAAELAIAGLLVATEGAFALTGRGARAIEEHPGGLDRADLMAWPAYAGHVHRLAARAGTPHVSPGESPHATAYLQGAAARVAELPLADNPHPADAADHLAWENGWAEAGQP
jgi:hypothetical protein